MAYNDIYEKLTADPTDLVGAFAYIIYKRQKVEFCKTTSGGDPSREEMDSFHAISSLDASITSYRSQAQEAVQAFLSTGLDDFFLRAKTEAREDVLYTCIENVNSCLQSQLIEINQTLRARRTWTGWMREVGGNLIVNIVTILVIGVLVLGYKFIGELQQTTEMRAGLGSESAMDSPAADG